MFQKAAVFDQPLNAWDVSQVTNMQAPSASNSSTQGQGL